MLDLNDVAIFVQVVRCGSFAEAARRLGTRPTPRSRRVQQLEAQLGAADAAFHPQAVAHAGQDFHARCAGAVDGLVDAGQALMSGNDVLRSGLVRVAAPADFFDIFPMESLAAFRPVHPQVRVDFVLSDARADIIGDRIDVAIRGGVRKDSACSPARCWMPAGTAWWPARPTWRQGAPARLADLVDHDCLVFTHRAERDLAPLRADGEDAEVQVGGRFSGNTAQALRKAALAGLGGAAAVDDDAPGTARRPAGAGAAAVPSQGHGCTSSMPAGATGCHRPCRRSSRWWPTSSANWKSTTGDGAWRAGLKVGKAVAIGAPQTGSRRCRQRPSHRQPVTTSSRPC